MVLSHGTLTVEMPLPPPGKLDSGLAVAMQKLLWRQPSCLVLFFCFRKTCCLLLICLATSFRIGVHRCSRSGRSLSQEQVPQWSNCQLPLKPKTGPVNPNMSVCLLRIFARRISPGNNWKMKQLQILKAKHLSLFFHHIYFYLMRLCFQS